jgi:hypothetical protein
MGSFIQSFDEIAVSTKELISILMAKLCDSLIERPLGVSFRFSFNRSIPSNVVDLEGTLVFVIPTVNTFSTKGCDDLGSKFSSCFSTLFLLSVQELAPVLFSASRHGSHMFLGISFSLPPYMFLGISFSLPP